MWAVSALCGVTIFGALSRFGIWDPWELDTAERARAALSVGDYLLNDPRGAGLVALSFKSFGVHEWSGRLPGALIALVALVCTTKIAKRVDGSTCAAIAGFALLSTPLFLLNTVPIGGHGAGMVLQSLIACTGLVALDPSASTLIRWSGMATVGLATAAAVAVHGAMFGALPPLLALSAAAMWNTCNRARAEGFNLLPEALMTGATALLCGCVFFGVLEDDQAYALWTGGPPTPRISPAFDQVLERTFHGLGPWSALLPFAVAYPFSLRNLNHQERRSAVVAAVCAVWCLAGYGAQTLFLARYGTSATFLPVTGVAVLCGMVLSSQTIRPISPGLLTLSVSLLLGLQIRDYALAPDSPLQSLPVGTFALPDVFNPSFAWASLLGTFGMTLILTLRPKTTTTLPDSMGAPYRTLMKAWDASCVARLKVSIAGLLGLLLLIASGLAWVSPDSLSLSSLGEKALRMLGPALLAAPLCVVCVTALWWGFGTLGRLRNVPLLVVAGAISLYTTHGFLPAVSAHLSPRDVFETFNDLTDEGQELAEFEVGETVAGYYVSGRTRHVPSASGLVDYLVEKGPRWAVLRAKNLGKIDSQYRHETGEHLVVADARSARILLVTNHSRADIRDFNALSDIVLDSPPKRIQHPTRARFGDHLELLGFDIESRVPGSVGAGETLTLVWYYQVLDTRRADYKVFVHIDGLGTRVHGDHRPTGTLYPMRLWAKGDVIVDRHEVTIPATAKLGDYQILMGFYKGERRLPVTVGAKDDADRVKAGRLRIQ